jgi:ubiquinone biosynthesis protein
MAIKIRHTNRYREIVMILVRHGFGYMVEEMGLFQMVAFPRKWLHRKSPETAKTLGERIRLVLQALGPTFIKLGQLSSTRHDLLPEEVILELQKLQDQVPPFSFEEVRSIIEQELHMPLQEIFEEISQIPLAAASIGQVHYGKLITGQAVAVKVQRPLVAQMIELDLGILGELATIAEQRVEWVAQYQLRRMIEELSKSMREEVNYRHEGRNADRIARQFIGQSEVYIPKVYWDYTTSKVLMLEYIDGIHLNQPEVLVELGHDLKQVAERLVNSMLHQVLMEGFFHADPHPGNIMVLADGSIAYVDFGMAGRLNEEMKEHLVSLLIALMRKDSNAILRAILRLGLVAEEMDTGELQLDLDLLREKYYDIPLSQVSLGAALNDLFVMANRHHIVIPKDLTLVGKALITVEGVAERLDPELSIVGLAEPFGRRLLKERFHPQHMQKKWWRQFTDMAETIISFPRQASQLTKLVRTGKLKVEIGIPEINLLLRKLDQISNRITISIVLLSFSIIMVGLIIASPVGKTPSLILHFPVIEVGSSVAGLMLLWLLYSIFKSGRS